MTDRRSLARGAVLGALALVVTGCGSDRSVSVELATDDARSLALSDASALEEAVHAADGTAAARDVADSWAASALGAPVAVDVTGDGDVEVVLVYDTSENQGGGWFSEEVVVRLCTRLRVPPEAGAATVVVEGADCPADIARPRYGDVFVEVPWE